MDRRDCLKTMGAAAGCALIGRELTAREAESGQPGRESMAILIDTTRCLGCRMCEMACAKANGLPDPSEKVSFEEERKTSETQWTVVNRYETDRGTIHAKKQCMHCLQPACGAACLTRAMYKTEEGPVIWREDKCMGCRFCMVSCPFDIPKFEYDSPNPRIQKCVLCWERLKEGEAPACVQNCPAKALSFGPRSELLETARQRIYAEPEKYVHHIYGEHEAGGTSVLYLAAVPFEQLGFPTDLGTEAYPAYTREFLYAVPLVLVLFPTFLLALSNAAKERERSNREGRP